MAVSPETSPRLYIPNQQRELSELVSAQWITLRTTELVGNPVIDTQGCWDEDLQQSYEGIIYRAYLLGTVSVIGDDHLPHPNPNPDIYHVVGLWERAKALERNIREARTLQEPLLFKLRGVVRPFVDRDTQEEILSIFATEVRGRRRE